MSAGKWWAHEECDRVVAADRCEPCRLWAEGSFSDAQWSAAAADAERCEWCGEVGHDYTAHVQAVAEAEAWLSGGLAD